MWVLLLLLPLAFSMPFDLPEFDQIPYSDGFARNKILALCGATNNQNPQICLDNQFYKAQIKRRIDVPCSKFQKDRCVGFSAVETYDQAIMLAFKGTDGFLQLLLESEQTVFSNKTVWPGGGYVSKYFADAFLDIWNGGMKDDFNVLKNQYPGFELWIAGHSLGGAMASLAASYIVNTGLYDPALLKVVTFGQPRTGDKDWAAAHDKAVPYSFRITHAKDIVPHLPLQNMEQYHHCLTEVYYNNDMSQPDYKVCAKEETLTCSDGQVDSSFIDHSYYFNTGVSSWGAAGCKNQ